MLEQGYSKDYI